jgi:putative acetyltransferase
MVIERVAAETGELRALIVELDNELGANYEAHHRHGLSLAQLFEPHVRFFMLRLGGAAVGCGGVALFDDFAEVKRMYARPEVRGRGLAKALLAHIEDEARRAGKAILRLETGPYQQAAIGLYQRVGFRPCRAFGAYATMPAANVEMSLFFEKSLN